MKRLTTVLGFALTLAFLFSAVATPVAYTSNDEGRVRVLVQFAPGKKAEAQKLLGNANGQVHFEFDALRTIAVTVPEAALAGLSHNPNIVMVEEDAPRFPVGINESVTPNVELPDQVVPFGVDMVQARDVWDADRDGVVDAGAPTGANRTVCIIDSGFFTGHEDLAGVNVDGYDGNLPWASDYSGHGSHVAGTIAAMNNALGVIGVTPGTVNVYSVRVFGDDGDWAYSSTLIDAANRCADAGANVISMSLGGGSKNNTEERGFDTLYANGILSIAAAGNDGTTGYSYPASYDSVVSVAAIDEDKLVADFSQKNDQVELAAPGVAVLSTVPYMDISSLTVDGVTYAANHIEYAARGTASAALVDGGLCTSTGAWAGKVVLCERGDISFYDKVMNVQNSGGAAAVLYNNEPGNFLGTLGDGASSSIVALSISQEDGQYLVANKLGAVGTISSEYIEQVSGYEYYDGTSMATPHTSAVAALVWSADPTATNVEIRDVLATTAQDLGNAGRDTDYGFGLVQAYDAIAALTGGGTIDNAPVVNISSPASGASFTSGESISFAGSASDVEDGDLSSSLVWMSSLDGQIGTGASFSTVLSDGTHTITAEVTDSGANTSSDSIVVTVDDGSGTEDVAMYVANMTGSATVINRRFWAANASVQVLDANGAAVANVTVSGVWSGSYTGASSCVTDASGSCTVVTPRTKVTSPATFTVSDLAATGYYYDAALNVVSSVTVANP